MSKKSLSSLRDGDRVRVRGERWRVGAMESFDDCETLHLTGCGRHNRGVRRVLLYPFDRPQPLDRRRTWTIVRPNRWLNTLRRLREDTASQGTLRGAASALVDLHAYQLEPALHVVKGHACRLLLADEVGLGKTIQVGFAIRELELRGWVRRVLIVTPSGLVDQWRNELVHRFALPAEVMDAGAVRQRARSMPTGESPWSLPGTYVTSIDFVKRPDVRRAMEQALWDVLVVDEAHLATPGSDRGMVVRALSERARYVVLVTATPHSGNDSAYTWLSGLESLERDDRLMMFRRTRRQLGFPARRPARLLRVRPTRSERLMHDLLRDYAARCVASVEGPRQPRRETRDGRAAQTGAVQRRVPRAISESTSCLARLDAGPARATWPAARRPGRFRRAAFERAEVTRPVQPASRTLVARGDTGTRHTRVSPRRASADVWSGCSGARQSRSLFSRNT